MGRRGPAPAPTEIQIARGERRPSRVNYDEPKMQPPSSLEPPVDLDGFGLDEWRQWIGPLSERGVLTDADLTAFRDYCYRLSRLQELRTLAREVGQVVALGKVTDAILKTEASVDRLRDRLGLTPSSRTGVKAAKRVVDTSNPADRYLRAISGGKTS